MKNIAIDAFKMLRLQELYLSFNQLNHLKDGIYLFFFYIVKKENDH